MLHDIHVFLHEHRWWVLVVTVPLLIVYGRILVAHLAAGAPAEAPPRQPELIRPHGKPSAKFAETVRVEDIPRTLDAGVASQVDKGRAASAREPVTVGKNTDDDAMADLFSGLGEAEVKPGEKPTGKSGKEETTERRAISGTAAIRRAGRMEELGFHHSIPSDQVEPGKAPPMPVDDAATTARLKELTAEAKDGASKAAAPELDAILARIDQVLSQDHKKTEAEPAPTAKPDSRQRQTEMLPPDKPRQDPRHAATQVLNPITDKPQADAAKAETAKKSPPLWARSDAFDEDAEKGEAKKDDGKQLGLFDQSDKPA